MYTIPSLSQMTVREVEDYIKGLNDIDAEVAFMLNRDKRKSVQAIHQKVVRKQQADSQENNRLEKLLAYEKEIQSRGKQKIAGIDEAGRGPIAGPVVAATVILSDGTKIKGINDSKKLSATRRQELFVEIWERSVAIGFGVVSHNEIDLINIHHATLKAMRLAVERLTIRPEYLIIDGTFPIQTDIPQKSIIDGDAKSQSIAAASILAKVVRDRIMVAYDWKYPLYGFARHKGYGTSRHFEAIKKYGLCPIHRRSFSKSIQVS